MKYLAVPNPALIALSHLRTGYSAGLVMRFKHMYLMQNLQIYSSQLVTCSWWGFVASVIRNDHGLSVHGSINLSLRSCSKCSVKHFDSCKLYGVFVMIGHYPLHLWPFCTHIFVFLLHWLWRHRSIWSQGFCLEVEVLGAGGQLLDCYQALLNHGLHRMVKGILDLVVEGGGLNLLFVGYVWFLIL